MKRPSIFVIKAILRRVDKGKGYSHKARFGDLAKCTPELRNEKSLGGYLKLLVEELHWIEKFDETQTTLWNPFNSSRMRRWTVSYYRLSESGKQFLSLFPQDLATEQLVAGEPEQEIEEPEPLLTPQEERKKKWYDTWC